MGFQSREAELRLKLADLLLTLLKDASIKSVELGVGLEDGLDILATMTEELAWAIKYHRNGGTAANFRGFPGFGTDQDDGPPFPKPGPKKSPYNRS
jgi:hypothetical protein